MWIKREFIWHDDPEQGAGWQPSNRPDFNSVMEFGVAHDALEHFTLDGTIEEEARAFGAMLWNRVLGQWGYRMNPRGFDFAGALHEDMAEFIQQAGCVSPAKALPLREPGMDEILIECAALAYDHMLHKPAFPDYKMERAQEDLKNYVNWARIGYRMAARRWGRHMSPFKFADLFQMVAEHKFCKATFEPESENDKLIVRALPSRRFVEVDLVEYQDPYA